MVQKLKSINKEQITKAFFLTFITLLIMLVFEFILLIPGVKTSFLNIMNADTRWMIYLGYWFLIFLQTTIVPIPAITILAAANRTNMISFNLLTDASFYFLTISSYMVGVIVMYLLGRKWGKYAIKWVAGTEEEYNKWIQVINKKGKLFYFLTVMFPLFPDDLLCFVAGGVKLNFKFFIFSNLIGRTIGLVTAVYTVLIAMNSVSSFSIIIIYISIMLVTFILWVLFRYILKF
jgi:membrane protein YqaA with SNARE-associated domain